MERRRGRRPARQARPPRLRAVEGPQGRRAGDGLLADAVRPRPPGLAPRVLGDGAHVPRRHLRHPRRRHRPALPAPRERAGPVARGRTRLRPVLDAQRLGDDGRREDEQVARQRPARSPRSSDAYRPLALRYYLGAAHYRSTIEYHEGSLDEAAAAVDRIEGFLRPRRCRRRRPRPTARRRLPAEFREAMDDDLNVSGALAVVHDTVRAGNTALDDGDDDDAARGSAPRRRRDDRRARASTRSPAVAHDGGSGGRRGAATPSTPSSRDRLDGPAGGPRRPRLRPPPTPSATSSPQPASPSRTPPPAPAGPSPRRRQGDD